ncbi:MAG: S41 family peptidase, partial [Candidatus Andersenbacteria bacterium]
MTDEPTLVPAKSRASRSAIITFIIFFVGIFVGRYIVPTTMPLGSELQYVTVEDGKRQLIFPTFWEAWDELHGKYLEKLEDEQLFYGAVEGMVRAAGDPYTVFANPTATKQFEENIHGSFAGVGIEIGMRSGIVTVIAPLDGSPAKAAGVLEGDAIVAIDKEPLTQETTIDEVVSKIRGRRGTKVMLTVVHKDSRETADIEITRDTIAIESVKYVVEDGMAIITITSFNDDTAGRFTAAARQATQDNVRGLIIDVRNNPGGYLQSAVDIASRFLPRGAVVVSERGTETAEYKAEGNTILEGV